MINACFVYFLKRREGKKSVMKWMWDGRKMSAYPLSLPQRFICKLGQTAVLDLLEQGITGGGKFYIIMFSSLLLR